MAFTVQSETADPIRQYHFAVLATCHGCRMPICLVVQSSTGRPPSGTPLDLMNRESGFNILGVYPSAIPIDVPENIPDAVAKAFKQAAESRSAGHFDAACSMYRRAMELALKVFSPDIEAWKLEKRIDKMAAENRITKDLQSWAHELRLDGNDALHGDKEATGEMAGQMHGLCKFLLIYLYTLPAQVEAAKARRAE